MSDWVGAHRARLADVFCSVSYSLEMHSQSIVSLLRSADRGIPVFTILPKNIPNACFQASGGR